MTNIKEIERNLERVKRLMLDALNLKDSPDAIQVVIDSDSCGLAYNPPDINRFYDLIDHDSKIRGLLEEAYNKYVQIYLRKEQRNTLSPKVGGHILSSESFVYLEPLSFDSCLISTRLSLREISFQYPTDGEHLIRIKSLVIAETRLSNWADSPFLRKLSLIGESFCLLLSDI